MKLCMILLFCVISAGSVVAADCTIVGDSIAEGVARIMPECRANAKGGLVSSQILERMTDEAGTVIISAGSNDPRNPDLQSNLRSIRSKSSGRVIWVLPMYLGARDAVHSVAAEFRDGEVTFRPQADGVHPESYQDIVDLLRRMLNR